MMDSGIENKKISKIADFKSAEELTENLNAMCWALHKLKAKHPQNALYYDEAIKILTKAIKSI